MVGSQSLSGLTLKRGNASQLSRAKDIRCGDNFCFSQNDKTFLIAFGQNDFAFWTQILLPKHMIPSLASMKDMLTTMISSVAL